MSIARADLLTALRLRYDHHSASNVLEAAFAKAGMEPKDVLSPAELVTLRTALSRVGDRLHAVDAHLDALRDAPAKPAVAVAAKPAPAPAPTQADVIVATAEPVKAPTMTAPAAAPAPATGTTIVLTGVGADADELVMICGGSALLGDWKTDAALALVKSDGADEWTVAVELPADAEILFKFLVRGADGSIAWEPGENRTLVAKPRLEVTWR